MPPEITQSDETRTVYRTCPLCEATCGVAIEIEGDRVVRVTEGANDDCEVLIAAVGRKDPVGTNTKQLSGNVAKPRRGSIRIDVQSPGRRLFNCCDDFGGRGVRVFIGIQLYPAIALRLLTGDVSAHLLNIAAKGNVHWEGDR